MERIRFPSGCYSPGRCVYLLRFADRSVYVGITGTSNGTGTSTPAQRIGMHLKKRGGTRSALFDKVDQDMRDSGFDFFYQILPDALAANAGYVERLIVESLEQQEVVVRNDPIRSRCKNGLEQAAQDWARLFIKDSAAAD